MVARSPDAFHQRCGRHDFEATLCAMTRTASSRVGTSAAACSHDEASPRSPATEIRISRRLRQGPESRDRARIKAVAALEAAEAQASVGISPKTACRAVVGLTEVGRVLPEGACERPLQHLVVRRDHED